MVAAVAFSVLLPFHHSTSWHFFHDAAHALFATSRPGAEGGLDVYAEHPEFQFGPLSILVALPFAYLPTSIGWPARWSWRRCSGWWQRPPSTTPSLARDLRVPAPRPFR
ncbi:MAG: hypothetical protein F2692_04630 [Actinobacteria bacterium]|nr:hypothetical protein [Actinomycetota bacterium]MSY71265.1 hypothetical protein [Actinomycetota bacterium]